MTEPNKAGAQAVEFTLGPDDWLVLSYDGWLSDEQRKHMAAYWSSVLAKPGLKAVVLEGGMQLHVMHKAAAPTADTSTTTDGRVMVASETRTDARGQEQWDIDREAMRAACAAPREATGHAEGAPTTD